MRITITPTNELLVIDGVQTRVWEGRTDAGTLCAVLVHRLIFPASADVTEADRELLEMPRPRSVTWPADRDANSWPADEEASGDAAR